VKTFLYDLFKIDRCIFGSPQYSRMIGTNISEESVQKFKCVLITYLNHM